MCSRLHTLQIHVRKFKKLRDVYLVDFSALIQYFEACIRAIAQISLGSLSPLCLWFVYKGHNLQTWPPTSNASQKNLNLSMLGTCTTVLGGIRTAHLGELRLITLSPWAHLPVH